jgi:hypothetical protein
MNDTGYPVHAYLISPGENPTINLTDLKKVKQLKLEKTGPIGSYELMSFRITVDGDDVPMKEFVVEGSNLPDELLKLINEQDSKIFVAIDNIVVKIDGKSTRLPPRLYNAVVTTPDPMSLLSVPKPDSPAHFVAGEKEWRRYLERNLDPQVAIKKGCKSGTFNVVIKFMVDKEGRISNLTPISKNGYGLEEHVASTISKSPPWLPAIQGGQKISSYTTQAVTFVIGAGNPDKTGKADMKNQPGMLNEIVVTDGQ